MLSNKLNARRGFQPRRCGFPMRYLPNRCYIIIAQAGAVGGGQAHVPSFIPTSILNFISRKMNSTEPKKGVFFF
jgi:hypothetical protein